MKHKCYIIKRFKENDEHFEKIKTIYHYGKSLYLLSSHQLTNEIKINNYYDNDTLNKNSQYITDAYINDIKTLALNDYEMNRLKQLSQCSELKLPIYNSDVSYHNHYFNLNVIDLNIYFEFTKRIQRIYSIAIKCINNDYEIKIECVIDVDSSDLLFQFKQMIVDRDMVTSFNTKDKLIVCIKNQDYINDNNVIYVDNRNKSNISFTNYDNLVQIKNENKNHKLTYQKLVLKQLIEQFI